MATQADPRASVLVTDLTQLMREVDSFFCTEERDVAERYWRYYLTPEIERLFVADLTIQSHYDGPTGHLLYEGYDGMRAWADDIVALFTRFVRSNSDWQPLGDDGLLVNQRVEAVLRDGGGDFELDLWLLWLTDGDRISSVRAFPDRFLAEAAAGAERLASPRRPPA
jgi:ketosteroid isomerase-like protein